MIIEIFIAILIGILLGIITGLTPGVHINLIAAIVMVSSYKLLQYFPGLYIGTALISMAIAHTFLDILPTTFLGAADSENALTLLPSHKLLLEGKAGESIKLSIFGSFLGLLVIIIFSPIIIKNVSAVYETIKDYVPHILIVMSAVILWRSKNTKNALVIFILSGTMGIVVFSVKTIEQPLLPLLSGMFGVSALLMGVKNKIKIPEQIQKLKVNVDNFKLFSCIATSSIASLFTSFLPGLTSSHTTTVASAINEIKDDKDYIIVNSSINTISMFLSIIAIYSIEKARNGVIVALSNLMSIGFIHIIYFTAVCLVAAFISILLTLKFEGIFSLIMPKVNYKILCYSIISFIVILSFFISGWVGIIVLLTSMFVGISCILLNVERIHLMGALILPIILYFTL